MILKYTKNPVFRRNLMIMTVLWVTVAFNFYLMGFYLSSMQGDVNMNTLVQGIAMILAFTLAGPLISKLGKKRTFLICFSLAVMSSLLYIYTPNKSPVMIMVLVFMGRLGICPCYSLTFICSNELFPAKIKSSLFAFCNIIARGLCMFAPLVAQTPDPIPF
jgi:MFS family permease